MKRKQQRRQHARRAQHQQATRDPDRPALILTQDEFPAVERAHIVPKLFQRAWAFEGKVALHSESRPGCSLLTIKKAGTRPAYYRRLRRNGELSDDVEASLGGIETRSAHYVRAVAGGASLDLEAKGALAQFFAVQLMRGPAFFEKREEILAPMIEEIEESQFKPAALAAVGGDVRAARKHLHGLYMDPTMRFETMLRSSGKIAGVIGNMRWHVVRFAEPVVAYSDHPVVVWPLEVEFSEPFERQHLGPLGALEIRVPIAPDGAIVMNWADLPDAEYTLDTDAAAELNAFTVGQADVEWMHAPNSEPPVATGTFEPLSRLLEPRYGVRSAMASRRRAHAAGWIEKNTHRKWINNLKLLDIVPPDVAA